MRKKVCYFDLIMEKSLPVFRFKGTFTHRGNEAAYCFMSAESADRIPRHAHEFFEIFLVTNGEILHETLLGREVLTAGTLVFIRPDDVHAFRSTGKPESYFINLEFSCESLLALFDYLGDGLHKERLLDPPDPPQMMLSQTERTHLINRLNAINSIPHNDVASQRLALRTILFDLCTRTFPPSMPSQNATIPAWLDALCEDMQMPQNLPGGLPRLLQLAGRSHEYVCRAFKRHCDCTPTEFVIDLRLNYAANLLRHTDRSMTWVALEAGFENLSYFHARFKKNIARPRCSSEKKRVRSMAPVTYARNRFRSYRDDTDPRWTINPSATLADMPD